jgi:MFS family permease
MIGLRSIAPIWALLFIVGCNSVSYRASKVVVTLFAIKFGATQVFIGLLVAMYALFPMVIGLYAGRMIDRLGYRAPMLAGSLGFAIGLIIPYLWPSLTSLYLSAAAIGASYVFFNVAAQNLVGVLSSPADKTKNFSNYGLLMAAGGFIGPTMAGFSIDHFGHAESYLFLSFLPLVPVAMLASYDPFMGRGAAKTDEERAVMSASLWSDPPLRRALLTSGIVLTGTDLFQFYLPIYGNSVGLSASAIGLILGTFAAAAFIVRIAMPPLVRRWSPDGVLVASLFLGSIAYLLFPLFTSGVMLAVVAFALGLGMGCSQPISMMLIHERAPPERSGEAFGMRLTVNNFTHIAVPIAFGALGSFFGVSPVFFCNSVLLTMGGLISRRNMRS